MPGYYNNLTGKDQDGRAPECVPIKQCVFQQEAKILRYPTDIVGDADIKLNRAKNAKVERKTKQMTSMKLEVVKQVRAYNEEDKIFDKVKGKEKEKFLARNALPAYHPDKLEAAKASKGYMVKNAMTQKAKYEEENVNLKQYALEYARPQYNFEEHYEKSKSKATLEK